MTDRSTTKPTDPNQETNLSNYNNQNQNQQMNQNQNNNQENNNNRSSFIQRRQSHPESSFLSPSSSLSLTSNSNTVGTVGAIIESSSPIISRSESRSSTIRSLGGRATTPQFYPSPPPEEDDEIPHQQVLKQSEHQYNLGPLPVRFPNLNSNSQLATPSSSSSGTNLISPSFPSPVVLLPTTSSSSERRPSSSSSSSTASSTASPSKSRSKSTRKNKSSRNSSINRAGLNPYLYTSFPSSSEVLEGHSDDGQNQNVEEGGWWKWNSLSSNTQSEIEGEGAGGVGKDEESIIGERTRLLPYNATSIYQASPALLKDMEERRSTSSFNHYNTEGGTNLRRTESEREELEREGLIGIGINSRESRKLENSIRRSESSRALGGAGGRWRDIDWRYVRGEIECYGKHMLPPIIFFVFFVLGVSYLILHRHHQI